jgi:hypothetical protein
MKTRKIQKTRKTLKTLKIQKNKKTKKNVNTTYHYLISSHASSYDVTDYTTKINRLKLYTYVKEFGDELPIKCGYDLQTYLTSHRYKKIKPKCTPKIPPHINDSIFNVRVYVKKTDTWKSGILDISNSKSPRVVENWTAKDSNYDAGFTLNDALRSINKDVKKKYGYNKNVKVHVLTCM